MRTVPLGTLVESGAPIIYGILMPGEHVEGGVPVVKVRDIEDGRIDPAGLLRTSREIDAQYKRSRLRSGDILLSIRGTTGRVLVVPSSLDGANITQDTARVRVESTELRDYVAHALSSPFVQRQIALHTIGQAVKGINIASVRKLEIPLPSSSGRAVLVRVLDSVSRRLELVGRQVESKRRLKQALRQQLLTGKLRFPEFRRAEFRRVALRDVAHELSTRNRTQLGIDRVMGVLKHEGLVPMRERSIASDLSRYKRVPPNAFAYNPMRLNIGSIAFSWHPHDVLVSPDYEVFECDRAKLEPRYLDHVRRGEAWGSFVRRAGSGSVRVRIYFDDLAQFVFLLPSLDEQRRIAAFLDGLDTELNLLDRQLAAVRKLKRGLMQKLLTGELEVPAADDSKGDEVHA